MTPLHKRFSWGKTSHYDDMLSNLKSFGETAGIENKVVDEPKDSKGGEGFGLNATGQKQNGVSRGCYRTTSDGLIALGADWPEFLRKARMLGQIAMQTRHAYARMIVKRVLPAFFWRPDGLWMSDAEGALHFSFEEWGRAWGQLTPCECWGSLGRVSIRNKAGREFMQLCAVAESALSDWGAFFDAAVAGGDEGWERAHEATSPVESSPVASLPSLPADARWISSDATDLASVVEILQGEQLPVTWTLRTSEFCHLLEFTPRHMDVTGGMLSVRGGSQSETVQLGLPAVRALAVAPHMAACPLFVVGADDRRLITLSAPSGAEEAEAWRTIIHNFFPEGSEQA